MLRRITYVSGTGYESVELNADGIYAGLPSALASREWSYDKSANSISNPARELRKASVNVAFTSAAQADYLRRVCDRDMRNSTPGSLYVGEWSQRAYVVSCDADDVFGGSHSAKLGVVLLDGVWRKPHTVSFLPPSAVSGAYLDLPYDLPYDLAAMASADSIAASPWGESHIRLTVYGAASSPYIVAGGNVYKVDASVPAGGHMVVDSIAKTVRIVSATGDVTDAFGKAVRGTGRGGGSYIFQPLPAGTSSVSWDGSFGFDLTWYEEEGEPPWA